MINNKSTRVLPRKEEELNTISAQQCMNECNEPGEQIYRFVTTSTVVHLYNRDGDGILCSEKPSAMTVLTTKVTRVTCSNCHLLSQMPIS